MQTWDGAVKFLEEAAKHFDKAKTGGEDRAHWANVYNAENCRSIAAMIRTSKESLQVDKAKLRQCGSALVKQYQEYWPGSWPCAPEAEGLAMAVIKEYLTTEKPNTISVLSGKDKSE